MPADTNNNHYRISTSIFRTVQRGSDSRSEDTAESLLFTVAVSDATVAKARVESLREFCDLTSATLMFIRLRHRSRRLLSTRLLSFSDCDSGILISADIIPIIIVMSLCSTNSHHGPAGDSQN